LVKELDPANKPANDFFKSPAGKWKQPKSKKKK
jgi:hypothetical protein